MSITLFNATVLTPSESKKGHAIVVSGEGRIEYVGPTESAPWHEGRHIDVAGRMVAPGFIDIHRHGGVGVAFGAGASISEDLDRVSEWIPIEGITGFLCSIAAPDRDSLLKIVREYAAALDAGTSGADAIGLHLEGPYLDRDRKRGVFNPDWLRDPSLEEAAALLDAGRGWIRQVTMDPSLPGAHEVASSFRKSGVVVAMGHTDAGYEAASTALRGDFTHVTHTYNCLGEFHHRDPGCIGAVLASDDATTELIADTVHVHPGAMRILVRCVGVDRIVLISDAVIGSGVEDGEYEMLGHTIVVKDGETRLRDGTIAGSTAPFNRCVDDINKLVGVPLPEAVQMATLNPARVMGLDDRIGSVSVGRDADLIVINDDVDVLLTMVKGRIALDDL